MRVQIRQALPVVITPKCNIQFRAVRCSLRLLGITYAFLATEKTYLCIKGAYADVPEVRRETVTAD